MDLECAFKRCHSQLWWSCWMHFLPQCGSVWQRHPAHLLITDSGWFIVPTLRSNCGEGNMVVRSADDHFSRPHTKDTNDLSNAQDPDDKSCSLTVTIWTDCCSFTQFRGSYLAPAVLRRCWKCLIKSLKWKHIVRQCYHTMFPLPSSADNPFTADVSGGLMILWFLYQEHISCASGISPAA